MRSHMLQRKMHAWVKVEVGTQTVKVGVTRLLLGSHQGSLRLLPVRRGAC